MSGAKLFKECDTGIDSIIHNNLNLTPFIWKINILAIMQLIRVFVFVYAKSGFLMTQFIFVCS